MRRGPTPPTASLSPAAADPTAIGPAAAGSVAIGPSAATVNAGPAVSAAAAPAVGDAEGSSFVAPTQRRYHTRAGPTPPSPSHPRPARRAPSTKRARTSGLGESSTSRFRAPPSPPYQGISRAPDLSPRSIIR